MNLKERALQLKRDVPAVFICLRYQETPLLAKILAVITVGYALSPIDLIPDFIPVLGYLDDVLILPVLIALTVRLIPASVIERGRSEAEGLWQAGRPKRWYYGLPIVAVWIIVIYYMMRVFFKSNL